MYINKILWLQSQIGELNVNNTALQVGAIEKYDFYY